MTNFKHKYLLLGLLLPSIAIYYILANGYKYITPKVGDGKCRHHVHLCWLRSTVNSIYNQTISEDLFDFTHLYKLKSHIFMDKQEYHTPLVIHYPGPILEAQGKIALQYMKDEAFINGYQRPVLELPYGVDINGRNCSYNPFIDYSYTFSMHYVSDRVLVYVNEISMGKEDKKKHLPNHITGSVKTQSTVSSCENVDYFVETNGSYLISCPILNEKSIVTINAAYISIGTSNYLCNISINEPIWTLKEFAVQTKMADNIDKAKTKCTTGIGHGTGFWKKVDGLFHWTTTGCYYPYHFNKAQLTCLKKKSMIMFGDSHTKNRYLALKNAYNVVYLQHYQSVNTLNLLTNLLKVYESSIKNMANSTDVLIANVGHHDLRNYDIIEYISGMSDIFTMFQHFNKLDKPPKIIWIETLPVGSNGFHGGMMVNQVVEAVNDWVNHHMMQLKVEVVHAYEQAKTMTSQHIGDGAHYHQFIGPNVNSKIPKVNVGGAVLSVVVNMICPIQDL